MKHIVDGLAYQEVCNGTKCIDCPFLDNERNCKIGIYIRSQKAYQERPHGKWEWKSLTPKTIMTPHCSNCGHMNDFLMETNFCPECGANMTGEWE